MASRRARLRRSRVLDASPQRDSYYIPTFRAAANYILELEDRRRFEPGDNFPRALFHRSARLVVSPNVNKRSRSLSSGLPAHIKFKVPQEVALCVRRKQRRQVLFAMRRTGKGSRAFKRRRNEWSNIRC